MNLSRKIVTLFVTVVILRFCSQAQARWDHLPQGLSHVFSPGVHSELSEEIKNIILQNLSLFQNPQWVSQFEQDLREPNNAKRKLSEMSPTNAGILFKLFKVKDPQCDQDTDGVIKGKELKCLNKIWKYYVPSD